MEVVGCVTAAVSLTFQLVGTINKLKEFWRAMKNAPAEVEEIIDDLELLRNILGGFERSFALHAPEDHDLAVIKSIHIALQRCQRHVDSMVDYSNELQKGFVRNWHRTAFKATLRKHRFAEFAIQLEHAKTTLLMAINVTTLLLQEACGNRVLHEFSLLREDMMTFTMEPVPLAPSPPYNPLDSQTLSPAAAHRKQRAKSSETISSSSHRISGSDALLWLLQLPPDSPYRKTLKRYGRLAGRLTWQSSTRVVKNVQQTDEEVPNLDTIEDSLVISLELPIIRTAFTLRSQKCWGQWTHCFRTSRIVPDNAPIFKYCATKDELFIRKLFDSGLASPFDQTASGITLLHAAAAGYQFQIYKLLCDVGVEYGLCEDALYGKFTPIELTQNFTVCADSKRQTVQEWLGIARDPTLLYHPETNYGTAMRIWNLSNELAESTTDSEIITMLQGPLRLPREDPSLPDEQSHSKETSSRFSASLLLLCYYFLFHHDPNGNMIHHATIRSPSLPSSHSSSAATPSQDFYTYISQFWDRDEWISLLKQCESMDFQSICQRQQDALPAATKTARTTWDSARATWVRTKTTRFSSSDDPRFSVWIGPLKDWVVEFEFEFADEGPCGGEEKEKEEKEYKQETWGWEGNATALLQGLSGLGEGAGCTPLGQLMSQSWLWKLLLVMLLYHCLCVLCRRILL